jgi:hypothetical protein
VLEPLSCCRGITDTRPISQAAGNIRQQPINTSCDSTLDCDIAYLELFLRVADPVRDSAVVDAAAAAINTIRWAGLRCRQKDEDF